MGKRIENQLCCCLDEESSDPGDCEHCQDPMPAIANVRVGGVVACDPDFCAFAPTGCPNYNADWPLERVINHPCNYNLDPEVCGTMLGSIKLQFSAVAGNKVRVKGRIVQDEADVAVFQADVDADENGEIDCLAPRVLPLVSSMACGGWVFPAYCDFSAATYEVLGP